MKRFCKTHFAILMISTFLLNGCASKDPVETIVDNHINHIGTVLEYTKTNFEQTTEIKYLENELETCSFILEDVKQTHYSQIDTCEAKINYWRLATLFLSLAIAVAILAKIKRWF